MKTFFKRSKYFLGLGLAATLLFSGFLTVTTPPQTASAKSGCNAASPVQLPADGDQQDCEKIPQDCPGATAASSPHPNPNGVNCPYYPVNGSNWTCPIARCDFPGGGVATRGQKAPVFNGYCVPIGPTYSNCPSQTINPDLSTPNTIYCTPTGTPPRGCPPGSVNQYDPATQVYNPAEEDPDLIGGPTDTGSGTDPAAAAGDPELECGVSWNPLTWMLCPFVHLLNSAISGLDTAINNLLSVEQEKIFNLTNEDGTDNPTGQAYYVAWKSFRSIALGILIIGALIMIVGQALGLEILDAYTVKKVLPRLIVAIIGISLSWDIMKFFVGFTNDLGVGVRQLIYFPFRNMGNPEVLSGGGSTILGLMLSGGLFALGIMGLLSFGLTALLGIFIAFMVLVLRQLVIVVLILFAPIAIAAYILPNTQGIWKLWYESFTKALMMYPIIMAFLAVGRVMAQTSSGDDASSVGRVVALIAYVIPYFLIPLTFRFAGGALRTLGGFVNDKGRGGFDRLKKYRGNKVETNLNNAKAGKRFNNTSALGRRLNPVIGGIASIPSAGLSPTKMRSRYNSAKAAQTYEAAEEIRTKSTDFALGAQDDRLLRAAAAGKGRADIRRRLQAEGITEAAELDSAVGIVERMQNSGSREAVQAAVAIQRFATGTGYNDANGNFDAQAAMQAIREASHGDRALAGRLLGTAKGVAGQAGQTAFGGASYGTLSGQLDRSFRGETVDGDAIAMNAFMSTDAATASRARTPHVQAMTEAVTRRIAGIQAGTAQNVQPGELGRLVSQLENFRDTATMYGAPDRQVVINQQVQSTEPAQRQIRIESVQHSAQAGSTPITYDIETRQPILPPAPPNVQQQQMYRGRRAADPNDPRMPRDED